MISKAPVSLARRLFAFAALGLLGGCIDSAEPILTDSQPLLGASPRLQFFGLYEGAAHGPTKGEYVWRDGRYVAIGGTAAESGDFTVHPFEGADLIAQSIRGANLASEYAIAHKLADGTYLLVAIDENDADDSLRQKFCGHEGDADCRVTTREAVLAFARATAAKPHSTGGLAVLLAQD